MVSVDWIDLADSDKWQSAVNTVVNLRVAQQAENRLSS
jgi:hypothetical protein